MALDLLPSQVFRERIQLHLGCFLPQETNYRARLEEKDFMESTWGPETLSETDGPLEKNLVQPLHVTDKAKEGQED